MVGEREQYFANVGCYMSTVCDRMFVYSDHVVLIAPSVFDLHTVVNICETNLQILACLLIQISLPASNLVHDLMLIMNILHLQTELYPSGLKAYVSLFGRLCGCSFDTKKSKFFKFFLYFI